MKTIYVKISEQCNLDCKHCYINTKSNEVLDINAFLYWFEQYKKSTNNDIELVFHGGEPLLHADNILNIIDNIADSSIQYHITTNLICELTDSVRKVLATCTVATSFDGCDVRFTNYAQHYLWERNCEIVKPAQVNVVLTSELLTLNPKMLFERFILRKIQNVHFERLTCTGRAKKLNAPSWEEVDEWLCKAHAAWIPEKIGVTEFGEFSKLCANIEMSGCRLRKCTKNVLTINPNGSIATCPNTFDKVFATIHQPVETLYSSSIYSCITKTEKVLNSICRICDLYRYCNGDCFQLIWQDKICPFPKKLFKKILNEYEIRNS